jgi:hypothetical protein
VDPSAATVDDVDDDAGGKYDGKCVDQSM